MVKVARWYADPIVAVGAVVAMACNGWVWFAGEYVNYIDYSNHLGLISILAHGADTGALAYADRSFAPVPYLLFYLISAGFAQVMSVPSALKVSLILATGLCTYGGAFCAERCGRSPRLGLLTPLTLFGYALGYGFVSYVFTIPLFFFTLGACEGLLTSLESGRAPWRRWGELALFVLLTYLGHAFVFMVVALLVGLRVTVWSLARLLRPEGVRLALRGWGLVALSAVPTAVICFPVLVSRMGSSPPTEDTSTDGPAFTFVPIAKRFARYGGDLLERGSVEHWDTMYAAAALFGLWVLLSLFRPHPTNDNPACRRSWGLEIFAAAAAALYLFGPEGISRPIGVWMVYPRFAVLAAGLVFLLPRPDLRGWIGVPAALLALGLVAHNAVINHGHIEHFNASAKRYDPVRAMIPRGSRVLALNWVSAGDVVRSHQAMGSLYFYHLADGAAYTAFLFDVPLLPVRPKLEGRPRAPHWRHVSSFDPRTHGKDFDFLVLRGKALTDRADASKNHRRYGEVDGWVIYETIDPTPKR